MPARVLVVEDDRAALTALVEMLQSWGYCTSAATSAAGALAEIQRNCPDVVLSDLVMPGMDGLELLRAIRAIPDCAVAFFMITGAASASVAINAIGCGADECMLKPVDQDDLRQRLEERGFLGASS